MTTHKSHTIEREMGGPGFIFFPTSEGYYHDGERDNAQRADSIEEAKEMIDELEIENATV
jgi:hypothetical protein